MKAAQIIFSWDTVAAIVTGVCTHLLLPSRVPGAFAKDVYGASLSMLSIMFSVFFAALAVIISSGDNEFIEFLEEEGHYTVILSSFRLSLASLFLALLASLVLFATVAFQLSVTPTYHQERAVLSLFSALTAYALVASVLSTWDAIRYAHYRAKFMSLK